MRADADHQRVHTVSRKSERLVNLTIALLATKRYLTKNEIFRSIEGYEGNEESKERMFERDKDDLRTLGIEIEVGGLDPLFNDEAGYRIKPENYALDLGEISGTDIALLSLAAQAWNGAALDSGAQTALLKLKSMGIASDLAAIPTLAPRITLMNEEIETVLQAIANQAHISFEYFSIDLIAKPREIAPYAVGTRNGHWYFTGMDLEKKEIRTFRIDRVASQIQIVGKSNRFTVPTGFDLFETMDSIEPEKLAVLEIRKGKAAALRKAAMSIQDLGEWERIEIAYGDSEVFIDTILWHLDDVVVNEPAEIRGKVIETLKELVRIHG